MTDLTDRMRTCAAHMAQEDFAAWRIYTSETQDQLVKDAAELLLLAAAELEKPIEVRLGEPMAVIPPPPPETPTERYQRAKREMQKRPDPEWWLDPGIPDLPRAEPVSKSACPKCDSRATKTVRVNKNGVFLNCPVCNNTWKR